MSNEQNPINGEMPKAPGRRSRLRRVAKLRVSKLRQAALTAGTDQRETTACRASSSPLPARPETSSSPLPERPETSSSPLPERPEAGPVVAAATADAPEDQPKSRFRPHLPYLPEPVEKAAFALQERLVWPLEDRLAPLGGRIDRRLVGAGGLALGAAAAVAAVIAFSGGGSSTVSTAPQVAAATAPRQPLASAPAESTIPPKQKQPAPTLHGAAPVFTPAPAAKASDGGADRARLGSSEKVDPQPPAEEADQTATAEATAGTTDLSSPAAARISSDPKGSKSAPTATDARVASAPATLPEGPPAGPAALEVARQFADGFVVYETGGAASRFKGAFKTSATPELTKALLQRPPRQPDGVKVPRAKVVNVVAGPSQGTVYKVSVSLLRVGVTSELRLDMEKLRHGEWRVTNVLG